MDNTSDLSFLSYEENNVFDPQQEEGKEGESVLNSRKSQGENCGKTREDEEWAGNSGNHDGVGSSLFPRLRTLRALQRQNGIDLSALTPLQLGEETPQITHHVSKNHSRGFHSFRVRICKTCSGLNELLEFGSYSDLESALFVNDAHEIIHGRIRHLHIFTVRDLPFIHMLKVRKRGSNNDSPLIPVLMMRHSKILRGAGPDSPLHGFNQKSLVDGNQEKTMPPRKGRSLRNRQGLAKSEAKYGKVKLKQQELVHEQPGDERIEDTTAFRRQLGAILPSQRLTEKSDPMVKFFISTAKQGGNSTGFDPSTTGGNQELDATKEASSIGGNAQVERGAIQGSHMDNIDTWASNRASGQSEGGIMENFARQTFPVELSGQFGALISLNSSGGSESQRKSYVELHATHQKQQQKGEQFKSAQHPQRDDKVPCHESNGFKYSDYSTYVDSGLKEAQRAQMDQKLLHTQSHQQHISHIDTSERFQKPKESEQTLPQDMCQDVAQNQVEEELPLVVIGPNGSVLDAVYGIPECPLFTRIDIEFQESSMEPIVGLVDPHNSTLESLFFSCSKRQATAISGLPSLFCTFADKECRELTGRLLEEGKVCRFMALSLVLNMAPSIFHATVNYSGSNGRINVLYSEMTEILSRGGSTLTRLLHGAPVLLERCYVEFETSLRKEEEEDEDEAAAEEERSHSKYHQQAEQISQTHQDHGPNFEKGHPFFREKRPNSVGGETMSSLRGNPPPTPMTPIIEHCMYLAFYINVMGLSPIMRPRSSQSETAIMSSVFLRTSEMAISALLKAGSNMLARAENDATTKQPSTLDQAIPPAEDKDFTERDACFGSSNNDRMDHSDSDVSSNASSSCSMGQPVLLQTMIDLGIERYFHFPVSSQGPHLDVEGFLNALGLSPSSCGIVEEDQVLLPLISALEVAKIVSAQAIKMCEAASSLLPRTNSSRGHCVQDLLATHIATTHLLCELAGAAHAMYELCGKSDAIVESIGMLNQWLSTIYSTLPNHRWLKLRFLMHMTGLLCFSVVDPSVNEWYSSERSSTQRREVLQLLCYTGGELVHLLVELTDSSREQLGGQEQQKGLQEKTELLLQGFSAILHLKLTLGETDFLEAEGISEMEVLEKTLHEAEKLTLLLSGNRNLRCQRLPLFTQTLLAASMVWQYIRLSRTRLHENKYNTFQLHKMRKRSKPVEEAFLGQQMPVPPGSPRLSPSSVHHREFHCLRWLPCYIFSILASSAPQFGTAQLLLGRF